ncbi:hypothetical protein BGZ58_002833 [Dissophora ornata]|nr:hypothetical protein BGZ58_002833 [Dissophora ornata]
MNSIILTGLQTPGSNPNPGRGTAAPAAPNGESNPQAGEPHQSNDSPMAEGGMDPENEDDERPSRFGPGPPSSEMVHELAKAATSIFQLAIRIKAWVGMTPEERELDEEINIIRGKRCLFMDGSTSMPLPGPDTQGHHRQGNEWASGWGGGGGQPRENGYTDQYDRSRNFDRGSSGQQQNGFRRNGDHGEDRRGVREQDQGSRSQFETPYGSYKSVTSLQGGMAASFAEKGLTRTKSSPCIKALGSDTGGDAPHQKYHYAKLMKRQNEQQKTLNGGQGGSAGLGLITTTVLQSSLSQLQGINFQFRRRPNSLTPPVNMVTAAGAGTGAGAGAGPKSRPDTAASVEEIEVDEDES